MTEESDVDTSGGATVRPIRGAKLRDMLKHWTAINCSSIWIVGYQVGPSG